MTGFPILMYYLWICLWFYDGKLVFPTSVDNIIPFVWRMWEHVRVVRLLSYSAIANLRAVGCLPQLVRLEGVFGKYLLPALPWVGYAWLYARRSSRPFPWIQDPYV